MRQKRSKECSRCIGGRMFFSKDMLVTARSVMKWDHYLCLNCGHEEAIGPWTQRVFIMPREWLEDELDTELRY